MMKKLWNLFRDAATDWIEDNSMQLAAALSYYTVFSLAPLVVIVVGLVGFFAGREAVREEMVLQMQELAGEQAAETVRTILQGSADAGSGLLTTVIGFVVLLFGATGAFGQLQSALNAVWDVEPKPGQGISGFIRTRLLSLTMVLGIGFLLLVSLGVSAFVSAASKYMAGLLPGMDYVWQLGNFVVSFLIITLLFAMIFKYLPDVQIAWRDVWFGAIVTSLLFNLGKLGIGFYLGHSSVGSAYGAAGSLIVILLWVYYSSLILFFGAELTQVYARSSGRRIKPSPHARRIGNVGEQQPTGAVSGPD